MYPRLFCRQMPSASCTCKMWTPARHARSLQHGRPVSWWVLHDSRRPHAHIGIQSQPRREGVAQPRRTRQATIHGAMSSLRAACADCNSLSAIHSMRPYTSVSVTHSCMALPPWSLPHVPCRVMGVYPAITDGRTSSFSVCHARPVSLCEEANSSGSWTCSVDHERFALISGIRFWELAGARAPGARHSSDQMPDYLSRLAQVSLGVAISSGLPSVGANSSNCSQSLLFTSVGPYGVLLHRLQGLSNLFMPHLHLCSVSARRSQLQLRRFGDLHVPDLMHHYSSGFQDWSRRPSIWFAGGLPSACSIRLGVDSLLRLLLSDAVVIGFYCSTITSCHPRIAGLCSVLVDVTTRICPPPSHARHPGRRCYRASWMVAITPGPFHYAADLTDTQAIMCPCQVTAVVPPPTCWATCTLHRIVHFGRRSCRVPLHTAMAQGGTMFRAIPVQVSVQHIVLPLYMFRKLGSSLYRYSRGDITPWAAADIVDVVHIRVRPPSRGRSCARVNVSARLCNMAPPMKLTQQPLPVPSPVPLGQLQLLLRLPQPPSHLTPTWPRGRGRPSQRLRRLWQLL